MSERLVLASPSRSMHAVAASTIRRRSSFSVPGGLPCQPWYPMRLIFPERGTSGGGGRAATPVERGEQQAGGDEAGERVGPAADRGAVAGDAVLRGEVGRERAEPAHRHPAEVDGG